MMTTKLFFIANVKQLRTGGSFRILLSFFRTSWGVGVLNSAIFNSFHNRVEFGTILECLRNFGGGGLNTPKPLSLRHWHRTKYDTHLIVFHGFPIQSICWINWKPALYTCNTVDAKWPSSNFRLYWRLLSPLRGSETQWLWTVITI